MISRAREALTVFWQGEEVPGLTFYGLRAPGLGGRPHFPQREWRGSAMHHESTLRGDSWEVVVWDVRVDDWPSDEILTTRIRRTLSALRECKCVVAWIGREGYFADPPDLFLPEFMSGGVLAVLSDSTGFESTIELDKGLTGLADELLLRLRNGSEGLALAT